MLVREMTERAYEGIREREREIGEISSLCLCERELTSERETMERKKRELYKDKIE